MVFYDFYSIDKSVWLFNFLGIILYDWIFSLNKRYRYIHPLKSSFMSFTSRININLMSFNFIIYARNGHKMSGVYRYLTYVVGCQTFWVTKCLVFIVIWHMMLVVKHFCKCLGRKENHNRYKTFLFIVKYSACWICTT